MTIPDSVTTLGQYSFSECTGLNTITFGKNLSKIGEYSFRYCYNITTVNYRGTEEEWGKITIASANEKLTSATINYNYTGE